MVAIVALATSLSARSPERFKPCAWIEATSAEEVPWYQVLLVVKPVFVSRVWVSFRCFGVMGGLFGFGELGGVVRV
jgi:hypothetical protein